MHATTKIRHQYSPGDEVVAELAGAETHNIERGARVDPACLPPWTIGVVMECCWVEGGAAYALRVEHDGCACVCVVRECEIEGLA
ncbi:MAG: hypothetical protein WEB52_03930 [Dehalococcoidia bacterium]